MVMADPIGIVTVVAACASLARVTYRKCRDCRGEYQDLKNQARGLQQALEDLEDLVREHELTDHKEEECWDRARDCKEVLEALEAAVDKFQGTGERRNKLLNTWDGIRWDKDAVQELRGRLNTTLNLLTAFYANLVASSQIRIEKALYALFKEFQDGERDTKSVSRLTAGEGEVDDSEAWPDILTDLEDVGLDKETAENNRHFIVDWFVRMKPVLLPAELGVEEERERPISPRITELTSELTFRERTRSTASEGSSLGSPNTLSMHQRFMEPFGKVGIQVDERVRKNENTFKDDLNRAREYWKRRNWFEVKKHLLPILVAAQLPTHRRLDIKPRTAAFLSGVAYSYSGDLEMAKAIMRSILTPLEMNSTAGSSHDFPIPASDDGQIAAATWLGDICIKTYRLENAAFAWALAFDAVLRKAQNRERAASNSSNIQTPDSPALTSPSYPPAPQPKLRSVHSGGRDQSSQHLELQTKVILRRLAYCHQKTNNLNSLLESLESNWDLDGDETVFTHAKLMSRAQMARIAKLALNAVERADSSVLVDAAPPRASHARSKSTTHKETMHSRSSIEITSHSTVPPLAVAPAEDFLTSPVRSSGWPLEWDPEFHLESALRTIDWFFSFTPLSGEGVLHNLEMCSSSYVKEHPAIFVDHFDEKERDRFIKTLKRLIGSLGFECKEQPAAFRCRNRTTSWSRFASIACFELHIIKYRTSFIPRTKMAAYICNILHWNNLFETKSIEHADSKSMLSEMKSKIKIYEAEARGELLPSSGPDVAAQAA